MNVTTLPKLYTESRRFLGQRMLSNLGCAQQKQQQSLLRLVIYKGERFPFLGCGLFWALPERFPCKWVAILALY